MSGAEMCAKGNFLSPLSLSLSLSLSIGARAGEDDADAPVDARLAEGAEREAGRARGADAEVAAGREGRVGRLVEAHDALARRAPP